MTDNVVELTQLAHEHIRLSVEAFKDDNVSTAFTLAHAQLATAYSQLAYLEFMREQAKR